jgi:hypothetical protein
MSDAWAVAVVAVVGPSLGIWLKSFLEDKREKQSITREANYLAIRVSVILDEFASDCSAYIGDQDLHSQSEGDAGTCHAALPELKSYPEDANWKVFSQKILGRVLSFPNQVKHGEKLVSWFSEHYGEPSTQSCYEECGRLGYIAWKLATDIRQEYGFPAFDKTQGCSDVLSILEPIYDEVLKKKALH